MRQCLLIIFVALLASGACFAALDEAELARIEKQLSETSLLHGEKYIQSRKVLEAVHEKQPEYIRQLSSSGTNWQSRLIAEIVIERVERQDRIQAFLEWKHSVQYDRAQTRRIHAMGKAIAENANDIPLFLIEAFWKQNELDPDPRKTKFFKADPQWAYLASAIAQMKLAKARPALEEALCDEFYEDKSNPMYLERWISVVKTEVAKALGEIGSPESLPTLLRMLDKDPKVQDRSTLYALGALKSCMDESSETLLTQKLSGSTNEDVKMRIRTLLQEIKKSEK